MKIQHISRAAVAAIVIATCAATTAQASPVTSATPIRGSAQQRMILTNAHPAHIKSWLAPTARMKPTATTQLIYASVLTSASTGQTNIYQKASGSLKLVGQLAEGGGPIAVDSKGNVYVAESGSNALGYVPRNVYVYAPGSTTPARVLQNPNYMSWAVAVAKDGTVFVAGPSITTNSLGQYVAGVMKYAPGATTGTLLPADPVTPWTPGGMTADSNDNVFVGWAIANGSGPHHCLLGAFIGCVRQLSAGGTSWKWMVPFGGAANGITTGPLLGSNNSKTITVIASQIQYLMTFPNGSAIPSQVTPIAVTNLPIYESCFDGTGYSMWVGNTLFNSPVAYTIWQIDYPTGTIRLSYPIPESSPEIPVDNGIAVSPAYYPN